TAIMEMPVAPQLGTTGTIKSPLNLLPCRPPVFLHVGIGDLIRDALIADRGHQPVKHRTGVPVADCCSDFLGSELRSDLFDQVWRPCQATNGMDQPGGMVECRTSPVLNFGTFLLAGLTTW